MNNIDTLKENIPLGDLAYYDALNAFNKVVNSHFSFEYNEKEGDEDLTEFRDSFKILCDETSVTCTPKVHAVLYHVPDFCKTA